MQDAKIGPTSGGPALRGKIATDPDRRPGTAFHARTALLTTEEVSALLFEPPSREEREKRCLAHVVEARVLSFLGGTADVACYRGTSLDTIRRFELLPSKGELWEIPDIRAEHERKRVAFSKADEVRSACPEPVPKP